MIQFGMISMRAAVQICSTPQILTPGRSAFKCRMVGCSTPSRHRTSADGGFRKR